MIMFTDRLVDSDTIHRYEVAIYILISLKGFGIVYTTDCFKILLCIKPIWRNIKRPCFSSYQNKLILDISWSYNIFHWLSEIWNCESIVTKCNHIPGIISTPWYHIEVHFHINSSTKSERCIQLSWFRFNDKIVWIFLCISRGCEWGRDEQQSDLHWIIVVSVVLIAFHRVIRPYYLSGYSSLRSTAAICTRNRDKMAGREHAR